MDAGSAHGVSAGAEFAVYADENAILIPSLALGTLAVKKECIALFQTIMALPDGRKQFEVTRSAVALQTKLGEQEDFTLHVALKEELLSVFEAVTVEMQAPGPERVKISLVGREQAKLEVVREGKELYFTILDKRVTEHGLQRMPFPVIPEIDAIRPVLRAAARFYWHFNRNSESETGAQPFQSNAEIGVEFFELHASLTELDENGDEILKPHSNPTNLYDGRKIDIIVDADEEVQTMYGMRITNNTAHDLYPGVFYFSNGDLSIGELQGLGFGLW